MSAPASRPGPDLRALFALFPPGDDAPQFEFIPGEQVPEPYHSLLVHEHHMTVTVEEYHGDLVRTVILARHVDGEMYARKILLALEKSGRIVQFGIVRVNLALCSPPVRAEIVAGQTPFGRILIRHNVLRRIEPTRYFHVSSWLPMKEWFAPAEPAPTYGRLAIIHCDERPAVELVEIVAPAQAKEGA